jgi:hypothetical protein
VKRRYRTALLALGFLLARTACADTTHEFWPELDLWYRFNERLQLLLVTAGERDSDSGDRIKDQGAGYLDARLSDHISLRGGYVYQTNVGTHGSPDKLEHRGVLDFTYRWQITAGGQLADRTRVDIRDIEGDGSYRVRNRLRFEQGFKLTRGTLVPYGQVEAFYDSRYDTVSRLVVRSGSTVRIGRYFEPDLYLAWQRDTQPSRQDVLAVGITLNARF